MKQITGMFHNINQYIRVINTYQQLQQYIHNENIINIRENIQYTYKNKVHMLLENEIDNMYPNINQYIGVINTLYTSIQYHCQV